MGSHTTCTSALRGLIAATAPRAYTLPPPFLLPAFSRSAQTTNFSTSAPHNARRDRNPARSVSALKHTGLNKKQRLSVRPEDLPQPRLDPSTRTAVVADEDHGLWEFFGTERRSLMTPQELSEHGRGWTVPELRLKDWDDLHRLWWVCIKERNRLNTFIFELKRSEAGYGDYEAESRLNEIKKTQRAIQHTLTERWYAWENAREAAMEDDEVNFYADIEKGEPYYVPKPENATDAFEPEVIEGNAPRETLPIGALSEAPRTNAART